MTTQTFLLGGDVAINRLGYGAMRLTGQPGNFGPYADWEGGKALLRRAVELGITFFDTARAYGPQWNEKLIADALHPFKKEIVIATKGGIDKLSATEMKRDASAAMLKAHVDDALRNLKVERIDLFQLHWIDPSVPLEVSVGALEDMRRAGKIRHIGLSNVTRTDLDRALTVGPIASVQNRFNQSEREHDALVDYTASKGIAFIPYGPLGAHPMRQGAILPAQASLAWLLCRSTNIVVIPGTTSIKHLEENWAAWKAV